MLELKNISFKAKDGNGSEEKEILHNVNFTLQDDQFLVITGPNGSGKSTLAKIVMGLEVPDSGKIYFNGKNITNASITERAKMGISFAFQHPVRFKGLKVKDILKFAAGKDLTIKKACDYLAQVGLCAVDYIDRELNDSFSGGEIKRVEIATLMARENKLSIFDEPEAGIDLWSFHNLIAVFEKLRKATKGSIMIISHQERILEIADQIIVMKDGTIEYFGKREDILSSLLGTTDVCGYYQKEI